MARGSFQANAAWLVATMLAQRQLTLHLPTGWPWRPAFADALTRLRALPAIA